MKTKYLLILTITLLLTACDSKSPSPSQPMAYDNAAVYQVHSAPIIAPQGVQPAPMPQAVMSPRKIAIRASIDVDVENINEAQKKLNGLIKNFGGHIENAHQSESSYYSANLKVPSDKLMATLDAIAKLGDKTSQSINKRDITERFNNNEERLKNLKLFREKMKSLLNRTTKIEEILRIERELNRVQTEIDMIERQLKSMQGSVNMSPIGVTLNEKTIYGPLGYIGNGIWWVVKKLFVIR